MKAAKEDLVKKVAVKNNKGRREEVFLCSSSRTCMALQHNTDIRLNWSAKGHDWANIILTNYNVLK